MCLIVILEIYPLKGKKKDDYTKVLWVYKEYFTSNGDAN